MDMAIWIQFSPIVEKMVFAFEWQDISAGWVNALGWIFMFMFIPMTFFSSWVQENKGLKFTLILGVAL